MSNALGRSAPAIRQDTLSTHFSDRMICLKLVGMVPITSNWSRRLLLFVLSESSASPESFPGVFAPLEGFPWFWPKLFGTRTGWFSNEFIFAKRDKIIGNVKIDKRAGRNRVIFTIFISISALMASTSMRSLSLNNMSNIALIKPSAFNLAIAILINANRPIFVTSMDILCLLGCRISAIMGTGRDDCGMGSLYHSIILSPPDHPLFGLR